MSNRDIIYESKGALIAFINEQAFLKARSRNTFNLSASLALVPRSYLYFDGEPPAGGNQYIKGTGGWMTVAANQKLFIYSDYGAYISQGFFLVTSSLGYATDDGGPGVAPWQTFFKVGSYPSYFQMTSSNPYGGYPHVTICNDRPTGTCRLSMVNSADDNGSVYWSGGLPARSHAWDLLGRPAAEGSPEDARFHFYYGDADGDGTGGHILTLMGDRSIGINITAPTKNLDVRDANGVSNGSVNAGLVYQSMLTSVSPIVNNVEYSSGNRLLYEITSTGKAKNVIGPSDKPGLAEVLDLQVVSYTGKSDPSKEWIGFIAEEVYDVHPAFAVLGPDYDYDDDGQRKTEDYIDEDGERGERHVLLSDKLVPDGLKDRSFIVALVNSVKVLKADNDSLQARVEALESG